MMLDQPKGDKYWVQTENGLDIDPNAPEWAKKEFHEYMKLMSGKPDKHGIITQYQLRALEKRVPLTVRIIQFEIYGGVL